jgi:hypothetical protein
MLLGAHVAASRSGGLHHGMHAGRGKIVHYTALGHGLRRGPVEEVSFAYFTRGQAVWVRSDLPPRFDQCKVIQRARARIGVPLHYGALSHNSGVYEMPK